jgi:isopentenyldiphosphate isomerase
MPVFRALLHASRVKKITVALSLLAVRGVVPLQAPFLASNRHVSMEPTLASHAQRTMDPDAVTVNPSLVQHLGLSLIGKFLVDIGKAQDSTMIWSLIPIDDVVASHDDDKDESLSSGARSRKALQYSNLQQTAAPAMSLSSQVVGTSIQIMVTACSPEMLSEHAKLLFVLARVLAQYAVACTTSSSTEQNTWELTTVSSEFENETLAMLTFSTDGMPRLFETDSTIEIVDMVDQNGNVLGMVPRNLVHSLNVLHRGIGLTVSKDDDFSQLYVHRRTDFKRIFPGLYDMFVGGVSSSGEDSRMTAAREVAEELGLSRALDESLSALSEPLFKCVVCTSYNRCVVTVFQYTISQPEETISWQEEEVSWGDFVAYDIVEAAADLSIQRLVDKKEWPGMLPAIQSKWKGKMPAETPCSSSSKDWATWDFVPDGLLVWEAWLKWRRAV